MQNEEFKHAITLLFNHNWLTKKTHPKEFFLLNKYKKDLLKLFKERFGMTILYRPQFIQLFKRPHTLSPWMGLLDFNDKLDYVLFCYAMAYVEEKEADTAFMLNEMIEDIDLNFMYGSEVLDWTNYSVRKSLVRVLRKLLDLQVIETIQGISEAFVENMTSQEVLYVTTPQSRYLLGDSSTSYTHNETFADYWQAIVETRGSNGQTQSIFQRLMMEPVLYRTADTEHLFYLMRKLKHFIEDFFESQTDLSFELTKDSAILVSSERHVSKIDKEIFPSRQVIDEILIQLAAIILENVQKHTYHYTEQGEISLSLLQWIQVITHLQKNYSIYWSKEYRELPIDKLALALKERAESWQLIRSLDKDEETVIILPMFARTIASMNTEEQSNDT